MRFGTWVPALVASVVLAGCGGSGASPAVSLTDAAQQLAADDHAAGDHNTDTGAYLLDLGTIQHGCKDRPTPADLVAETRSAVQSLDRAGKPTPARTVLDGVSVAVGGPAKGAATCPTAIRAWVTRYQSAG